MKKDIRIKGKMDQVKKSKRNREMKKKMKKWKKIKETTQCRKFKINGLEWKNLNRRLKNKVHNQTK